MPVVSVVKASAKLSSVLALARRRACRSLQAICLLLSLWPGVGAAADLAELEALIDESRLTFARFTGHPDMAWFRERAARASAVFIAPRVTRASFLFGVSWGTGILLVRDSSTGRWSQPAFYRISGLSFGLQIGGLSSEIVALATDDRLADEMVDGAFTLGLRGTLGAGRYGGGFGGSLDLTSTTGFLTVESPTGLFAGVAAGASLVLVRDGANEQYFGRPVELEELRENRVRQWYSDRLVNTLSNLSANGQEAQP